MIYILAYIIIGLLVYIYCLFSDKLKVIDEATIGSSLLFKLVIIPGWLVFWTLLFYNRIKSKQHDTNPS